MTGAYVPGSYVTWRHEECNLPDCCNEPFVFGEIEDAFAALMPIIVGLTMDKEGISLICTSPITPRAMVKIPWADIDFWRSKEDFEHQLPSKIPDVFFGGSETPAID